MIQGFLRRHKIVSVLTLSVVWAGVAAAGTVPTITTTPVLLKPDARGGDITTTYDGATLTGSGLTMLVTKPDGTSFVPMPVLSEQFFVSASVNSSGLATGGSLTILDNGASTLFTSGNLIGFGTLNTGTSSQFDFEFVQGSGANSTLAPPVGSIIGVVLNGVGISYSSTMYNGTFHSTMGEDTADAAPIAPLPKTSFAGGALLLLMLGLGVRGRLSRIRIG